MNRIVDINHVIETFSKSVREGNNSIWREYYERHNYKTTDGEDYSELMYACADYDIEKVKTLINNGADIHYVYNTYSVLVVAVAKSTVEIVNLLISSCADVNFKNVLNETALMYACDRLSLDIVETLLSCGADVNASDNEGFTPLMITCKSRSGNNIDVIKMLLNHGADKTLKNNKGFDALHYAESIKDDIKYIDDMVDLLK